MFINRTLKIFSLYLSIDENNDFTGSEIADPGRGPSTIQESPDKESCHDEWILRKAWEPTSYAGISPSIPLVLVVRFYRDIVTPYPQLE